MQVYQAADQSAESGVPIEIPPVERVSQPLTAMQTDSIKSATADRT